jgi:hypothetical protein
MKKIVISSSLIIALVLSPALSEAADFSLFGAKIGMPRAELDQIWQKLGSGDYAIDGSVLINVKPEFDHRDRMYKLTFTFPLSLQQEYPPHMVAAAFQEKIVALWGSATTTVTVRTGRGTAEVAILDKTLQNELTEHINAQVEFKLTEILQP